MNKKIIALLAILTVFSGMFAARGEDRNLVSGKLKNGLTYYIYRNDNPSGRADFFLSRKVGSIVEREEERGLAHFLEHLAFNGTEHFPGNSMIAWLESVGVKFGENLNAYTSVDETVYNICKVPVSRQTVVDSCLLVLRDWSCGLTLSDSDIEAERGVIKGEWRHRNNASNRLLQRAAPRIYGSSLYGNRLPMGLMSVVESFPPQRLRDFYRRNYNPDTEAIIVVGDIDPDKMEKKIKKMFSRIPASKSKVNVDRKVETGVPLMAVAECDPEQSVEMVQLFFKHPAKEGLSREESARESLLSSLLVSMLVERFDRLELLPDAPASNIGVGDTRFLLSEPMRALLVRGNARPGQASRTISDFYAEIKRAMDYGFLDKEFEDAKRQSESEIATALEKKAKRDNTSLAREISRSFLHGESMSTPREEYDMDMSLLSSIDKAEVEEYLRGIVHTDGTDVLLLHYTRLPESAGTDAETALKSAFLSVNSRSLERHAAADAPVKIEMQEPVAGKVIAERQQGPFRTEMLALSNGLKVYLRQNAEKPGQIYLRGVGTGGLSQNYSEADAPSLKLFNEVIAVSGAGTMSNSDLRRFTHGKDLKVSAMVSNTEETIEFAASRATLEDAFRLMHLKATDTRRDDAAFRNLMASKADHAANRERNPVQTMGDSITFNVYSRHPLGIAPSAEKLATVDYGKIMEVYKDRFSDFSDFNFYVTGDFDRDSVVMMLERYVASLPANGRMEKAKDIGYRFSAPKSICFSRQMETPVSVIYQFRHSQTPYSLQNVVFASAVGQILKARLLADLREKRGWTYGVTTHGSVTAGMNGQDPSEFMIPVYVKVDPAHAAEAAEVIDGTFAAMSGGGISSEEVDKVKEYMLKTIADNRRDNAYWLLALRQLDRHGLDMDTDYEKCVDNLSPESISEFMRKAVDGSSLLRITMTPQ